jgi:signal transduction histidine kinase
MVEGVDGAPRCDSHVSGAKRGAVLVDRSHGVRAAASTLAIVTETETASAALRAEDNTKSDGHSRALRAAAGRAFPLRLAHRVLAAADADRQRIERDLHDGVQQHLTGLRIRLAIVAADCQKRGDTDACAALNAFGEEVELVTE